MKVRVTLDKMAGRGRDELGRWYWRIRSRDPDTGTRKTLETGRWTPTEADEHLEVARARLKLGLSPVDDSTKPWTVSEVVAKYTEEMAERLGADHPYVMSETSRLAHVVLHIGDIVAERVTRQRLEQYITLRRKDPCRTGRPVAKSSLREECAAMRRAYTVVRELGKIACEPPAVPMMKSVPDDARPERRLTEAEVASLLRSAEVEEAEHGWEPAEGTKSRQVYDRVAAQPGIATTELFKGFGATSVRSIVRNLRLREQLIMDDTGRWFPTDPPWRAGEGTTTATICAIVAARPGITTQELYQEAGETGIRDIARALRNQGKLVMDDEDRWFIATHGAELGVWSLFTVLAWSGRRPVAVFNARRRDCERILDDQLPREERLMFWDQDKAGVGRGWGPVTEPAFRALIDRARQVQDPDEPLWRSPRGNRWEAMLIARMFYRIAERAGVGDVQLYDLRRFAITQILGSEQVRGRTAVARRFTGHRSDRALMRYAYAPQGEAEGIAGEIGWAKPRLKEAMAAGPDSSNGPAGP